MCVFFFKQKTAYEMRISDWSSDVCSSDLELRLSNGGGSAVRWVAGANYERSKVKEEAQASCPDSSTAPLFFPSCEPNYTSDQKMTNYAFFGNIEYDVVEAITLKAGTRYTKSKRDA